MHISHAKRRNLMDFYSDRGFISSRATLVRISWLEFNERDHLMPTGLDCDTDEHLTLKVNLYLDKLMLTRRICDSVEHLKMKVRFYLDHLMSARRICDTVEHLKNVSSMLLRYFDVDTPDLRYC